MLHIPETTQWLPPNTPAMLELRGPLLLPEVARELGLHEGQVVEAVVRVRGERMELYLNGRTIEVPPGWRVNAGQVVWVTAHANTQGQLVLRQFRTPEQARQAQATRGAAPAATSANPASSTQTPSGAGTAPGRATPMGAADSAAASRLQGSGMTANPGAASAPRVASLGPQALGGGVAASSVPLATMSRATPGAPLPPVPAAALAQTLSAKASGSQALPTAAVVMRAMPTAAVVLERGGVGQVPEFRADATQASAWANRLHTGAPAPAVVTLAALGSPVAPNATTLPNVAAALWSHGQVAEGPHLPANAAAQFIDHNRSPSPLYSAQTQGRAPGEASHPLAPVVDPSVGLLDKLGAPLRQLLQHPPGMAAVMNLMQPQVIEVLLRTPGLMQWAMALAQRQVSMRRITEADVRRAMEPTVPTEAKLLQGQKVEVGQDLKQVLVSMLRDLREMKGVPSGADGALLHSALADLEAAQLDGVRAQQQGEWGCQFVLPFSDAPAVHLKFKRAAVSEDGAPALWWVNLYTQSPSLGELWMRSGVSHDGEVDMQIWATEPKVAADARARAHELRDWLALADLTLAQLAVTDGPKPKVVNPPAPHGSVLDAQA